LDLSNGRCSIVTGSKQCVHGRKRVDKADVDVISTYLRICSLCEYYLHCIEYVFTLCTVQ